MIEKLARSAVACRAWRWMPGMLTMDALRVVRVDTDGHALGWRAGGYVWALNADSLPDLSDPATLGCLLELVRDAWEGDISTSKLRYAINVPPWCAEHEGGGAEDPSRAFYGSTEAEALVVALEAAP
jgi:hypothetical protein